MRIIANIEKKLRYDLFVTPDEVSYKRYKSGELFEDTSFFAGSGVTFSISDNMTFLLMPQIFDDRTGTEYGKYEAMFFARLKWSF